ncbi:long-chain fatty acid--CoA ligase [Chitiniphilus purpureus]|uniref:Long-chain fatty acid--CoA ligase n=1 Tax=Chitiniphilus purpureus TaxID=2981137 RepID=A0ABY6DSU3_9NEIS|nr:long-chain fatty acid--CoA ligase [Chitiniphilus sp. CD1]UXY16146.1 long-chain fatty acid--CoA ligase [Chitiniphilus sp. CD1]
MEWINERLQQFGGRMLTVDETGTVSYAEFAGRVTQWRDALAQWGIAPGERIGLVADYHIDVVALLQALLGHGCIVIPLAQDDAALFDERLAVTAATRLITVPAEGPVTPQCTHCRTLTPGTDLHPLLAPMAAGERPGFVIFTSGSTGRGKAVLLDYGRMTQKFRARVRESFRTLLFLKLDHIGGLNTLLSVMLNGGTIVTCPSRQANRICATIARHRVELLPTTPSFLTMLLMSGVHRAHDLSSLKVITYGTEAMPASTLANLHRTFPGVALKQTYGLSELGILSTRSRDSASRWMKIGGDGFELQVRDGTLWIRSAHAMLGYLNAPSPFDAEGWYDTGDKVEVDGEYFQILGRESEIINVAGEKVFPIEIESFLLTLDNVRDVIVREKKSPVVGQMVWAEFLLERDEDPIAFKKRVLAQCRAHLAPFKVPGFITLADGASLVGSRFKKIRKTPAAARPDAPASDPVPGAAQPI